MEILISKSVEEKINIDLSIPKYVRYKNYIYWKFHFKNEKLQITVISLGSDYNPFSISIKTDLISLDTEALTLKEGHTEITEHVFNTILQTNLEKYNILPHVKEEQNINY